MVVIPRLNKDPYPCRSSLAAIYDPDFKIDQAHGVQIRIKFVKCLAKGII